jgi:hypothetical protein
MLLDKDQVLAAVQPAVAAMQAVVDAINALPDQTRERHDF